MANEIAVIEEYPHNCYYFPCFCYRLYTYSNIKETIFMVRNIYQLIVIILIIFPQYINAAYFPEGDSRSGGMHNQVLLYTMTAQSGEGQSRMPWISSDEATLYFAQGGYGYEEIWFSTKSAGRWLPARSIPELNMAGYSTKSPALDSTMNRIYFSSSRPVGAPYNLAGGRWRLFTSTRKSDGSWNTPYFLNNDASSGVTVSTLNDGHDFGVFLSRDGNILYFNSSRTGTLGGYDIWYSSKNSQGLWTQPINIGTPINSASSEVSGVSVTGDNLKLFFCSDRVDYRQNGTDTYNIFQAVRSSTTQSWSSASISQVGTISPATSSSSWGVSWPAISADGSDLYYSDIGPFMWATDGYDVFVSHYSSGSWRAPSNLGRGVNNIIWNTDTDFLPFVAYLDATTYQAQDFMFDAILMMALSGSSSGNRYDGNTYKDDWTNYLDQLFSPERELDRLNAVVGSVKTTLNNPSYQEKIYVMIPYPSKSVTSFGDVDGDGITENLSIDTIRNKVVKWYINDFYTRWTSAHFTNLNLVGLYWMNELVASTDTAVVKATSIALHNLGLKFEWIPYYNATGYSSWSTWGFDCAEYQPNFAWIATGSPDPARVSSAATSARTYTMGIELEFDSRCLNSNTMNYRTYLDYGTAYKENFMRNCLIGLYQDSYDLKLMAYASLATNPIARDGYDMTYQFIKETYPYPLSAGKTYTYSTAPSPTYPDGSIKLTDYHFVPDSNTSSRSVGFYLTNPSVTFDFVSSARIMKVYAHLLGGNNSGISFPSNMLVETSPNGTTWTSVGSTSLHLGESGALIAGEMMVKFAPSTARYVRITFTRANTWTWLDELTVYGDYNLQAMDEWPLYN